MENCLFINPDNVCKAREKLNLKIAVIARPDWFLQEQNCQHIIIETARGVHTRCYLAESKDASFLIIYGRFDRIRSTSHDIDYVLTQEVISMLGITHIVGTFVAGSVRQQDKAGSVYIPHDFVGMGGHNQSRNKNMGFRNVDMFKPFCTEMREHLIQASATLSFQVYPKGVYVCFHGYPRIETESELKLYSDMGWDIVGQTLDPEATLAREAGCHYVAIAVTIDDYCLRSRFLANDLKARSEIDENVTKGRKKTFELFIQTLPNLISSSPKISCNCEEQGSHAGQRSKNFYYRPFYLCD